MKSYVYKEKENKSQPAATSVAKNQPADFFSGQNAENAQLQQFQHIADNSAENKAVAQLQEKANNTGLPDNLKAGIENLSGYAMDDVKVHYNSDKPAQLNAHAYAQGSDIHIASGQEKHLPHEAWHVVQQKQGRVKPTIQMHGNIKINDDQKLEREADTMGGRVAKGMGVNKEGLSIQKKAIGNDVAQLSLVAGSGKVKKGKRNNFLSNLTKYLGISSGQARCHLVPFGVIRATVMEQINAGLSDKNPGDVKIELVYLIRAIFPHGAKADNHQSNTNHPQLEALAAELYKEAEDQVDNIESELLGGKDTSNLADYGTRLIDALNNSPDNLRPGDSSTNSSISDNLDIPSSEISTGVLKQGTWILDENYQQSHQLVSDTNVLKPSSAASEILLDLLDSLQVGQAISAYSSGTDIQSSDNQGQKTGNMINTNVTPIAIEMNTGWYLFETN